MFNRGEEFNPRTDPIVRVQTHHLRARLAQYYLTAGAADPIVIELPGRTYVPLFRAVEQAAPVAETPAPAQDTPQEQVVRHSSPRGPVAVTAVVAVIAVAGMASLWNWYPSGKSARAAHEPDTVAQDLYIRGRYLLDRQNETALWQSIDCFRKATARDPQFAAAYAGLADANNLLAQYGYVSPREAMEEARRAARQALSIDPELAEAHVSLASISEAYDWNFSAAEREYRRAIELNPQLPAAHLWYGMFLRDQGRIKEALPELRRAEQLEPLSVLATVNLAYAFRIAGDSNAALEQAQRAVELAPELPTARLMLAHIYRSRSDTTRAEAAFAQAVNLAGGNPHAISILACAYAGLGRRQDSLRLFKELEQLAAHRYVSPYDMGNVALMLGDEDRAVTFFEEAYRQRSSGLIFLRNDKADSMRRSPRMRELIGKLRAG